MRVSKAFWLKLPEPEPLKLLERAPVCAAGRAARIAAACGEILAIGIRLPANAVRPEPSSAGLEAGSKIWPPPFTVPRYWLRLQKPGVALAAFVAGLQLLTTSAVGNVI